MRRAGQNPTDVEVFLQEFNQCSMSNVQCHMSNAECSLYPSNVHETIFSCGQVQDMVNKIDDGSGVLDFEDFLLVIKDWLNSMCALPCIESTLYRYSQYMSGLE